jgi:hypothetical protein
MDIPPPDDSNQYDQIKENFIRDFAKDRYNFAALKRKYGDIADVWRKEDYVLLKMSDLVRADEIRAEQFSNLKSVSYDIIAKGLNGETLTDHQVKLATWVLSGERAFAEAYAKSKGEQKALNTGEKDGTILEFIRGQKTD